MNKKYSIIIPLKDEKDNLKPLISEIEPVMNSIGDPWELICVDDGSVDGTKEILEELSKDKRFLRVITFKKNYGQSSAFSAGFKAAEGEYIITMDGDGQNDPADIPKLLDLINISDLVCGIREKRKDTPLKRAISFCANQVRSRVCQDGMKDTGCSLKVYRKSCLDSIKMYEGMHRFLPALFKIEGYTINQTPVNHRERQRGTSKYNLLNRSFNTIFDLFAVLWMRKRHLNFTISKEK